MSKLVQANGDEIINKLIKKIANHTYASLWEIEIIQNKLTLYKYFQQIVTIYSPVFLIYLLIFPVCCF